MNGYLEKIQYPDKEQPLGFRPVPEGYCELMRTPEKFVSTEIDVPIESYLVIDGKITNCNRQVIKKTGGFFEQSRFLARLQ